MLLVFQPQFVPAIREGSKTQTVRRTMDLEVGDPLELRYLEAPQKCNAIFKTTCRAKQPIEISKEGALRIDGVCIDPEDEDSFARSDGFLNKSQLLDFMKKTYGLPFEGHVIHWPHPHVY